MGTKNPSTQEIECRLLWRLARIHGWSWKVSVKALVGQCNFPDEQRARKICRQNVTKKPYVSYHQGRDLIWLDVPHDQLAYDLRDCCDYSELRIEGKLSKFDGF